MDAPRYGRVPHPEPYGGGAHSLAAGHFQEKAQAVPIQRGGFEWRVRGVVDLARAGILVHRCAFISIQCANIVMEISFLHNYTASYAVCAVGSVHWLCLHTAFQRCLKLKNTETKNEKTYIDTGCDMLPGAGGGGSGQDRSGQDWCAYGYVGPLCGNGRAGVGRGVADGDR